YRAKYFFPRNAHLRSDIGKDGGLNKLRPRQRFVGRRSAAENAARAFLLGDIYVVEHLLVLWCRRNRPDMGVRQHGVTLLGTTRVLENAFCEGVLDASLHQQA